MKKTETGSKTADSSKIPAEILREIEIFEGEVARLKKGEITADQFKPFRLQHGVYGQRQPGVQMFRVKVPQGRLNPVQLRRLADVAEAYATGVCHLSTRQNIQMHFAKIENVSTMMRRIAEVGLTTREACADTVRNVSACPMAGICPNEVADVTPYGLAITQHFLRNPICQRLPRKFKIALEGCPDNDRAATMVHDIGITAQRRDGRVGFRIVVGGGLGSTPRRAHVLSEFTPPEDLIAVCEAIIRVFDRHGQRQNRYKARMKFLIEKLGFEKFTDLWKAEFEMIKSQNGHYTLPVIEETPRREPARPRPWRREEAKGPFSNWLRTNVMPQKQAGYNLVNIKVPLGDITSSDLRGVADLCARFADGYIRVTIQQNFAMRWVHEADLPALYEALSGIGLAEAGAERIENIVACPGTDSCGLSITSSKGLARVLADQFPCGDPSNDDLPGMSIKVSGCQNACAQHQLASIGFQGVGKKVAGHTAPFYEIHLGGSNTRIGIMALKIPARRVPEAVSALLQWHRESRQPAESFESFIHRMGKDRIKEKLMPLTFLPGYKEDPRFYRDWGDDKDFTTEDLGPGECAGGAYEMMEGFLFEADQEIHLAALMADKDQTGHAVNKAYRAIVAAAKGLLVLDGVTSSIDAEVLSQTESRLVKRGILPPAFADLAGRLRDLGPKSPDVAFAREKIRYAKAFVAASHEAFEKLGGALKKEKGHGAGGIVSEAPEPSTETSAPTSVVAKLDLRGVGCPINYVRTKLKLEELGVGECLEVILDEGEPIRNVPKSLEGDGQKIWSQEKMDETHYRLVVEKVN